MNNPVIETQGLTKRFHSFSALEDLNLKIERGSCVAILGPNGAGKTTTIKILTGLLKPTAGNAYILGFDVRKEIRNALKSVGAVVETPEFPPQLTPNEILSCYGKLRGLSKQEIVTRIEEVMKMVKMSQWNEKKIGKFSKGMKQRIALASALLHDPEVIILDEPTSGLDPRGIIEVREIIKTLKKDGKTVFLSSHLLKETQEICDSVALIDKGRLVSFEELKTLNKNNNESIIQIDLLTSPSKEQIDDILKLDQVISINQKLPLSLFINFHGSTEEKAEFLKSLHEKKFLITTFKTLDSQLESLYMDNVSESVR